MRIGTRSQRERKHLLRNMKFEHANTFLELINPDDDNDADELIEDAVDLAHGKTHDAGPTVTTTSTLKRPGKRAWMKRVPKPADAGASDDRGERAAPGGRVFKSKAPRKKWA